MSEAQTAVLLKINDGLIRLSKMLHSKNHRSVGLTKLTQKASDELAFIAEELRSLL